MSVQIINPWEDPTSHDRLEIVFQYRFKNYGAYAIRRHYNRNKLIAMFASAALVALMFSAFKIQKDSKPYHFKTAGPPTVIDTLGVIPDYEEPETPNTASGEKGKTGNADLIPRIDFNAPHLITFTRNGNGSLSGDGNGDFGGLGKNGLPKDDGDGLSGGGNSKNGGKLLNRSCAYPGGEDAFIQYIQQNFEAPAACLEASASAWVKVQYSISADGSLGDVKILASSQSCPEFLDEARRVLLQSPKWIAALEKGMPVNCVRMNMIRLVY